MSAPVIGAGSVKPVASERPADYKRIYVWQFPVRLFHWVTAISIVLLCATGFLIGHPLHAFYAEEAYQQYWFGWVRFIHFASAFAVVAVSGMRLYWAFAGNRYANWRNFPSADAGPVAKHMGVSERRSAADQENGKISRWSQYYGGNVLLLSLVGLYLPDCYGLCAVFEHEWNAGNAHL